MFLTPLVQAMINFSQLLAEKIDLIIERWMAAVRADKQMKTDDTLSVTAVRDHVPLVLQAIVTILSKTEEGDVQSLADASLEHGVLRAEQGFDPAEIAREYGLLRSVIFSSLKMELTSEPGVEVYRVFRLIDLVIDEAIGRSFKSYMNERLKELEQLQHQVTMGDQEISRLVQTNQDAFSQQLTNQLRTPLSSIIGYTDLFLRQQKQISDTQSIAPRIEYIERALQNSRRLLRLINDTTELRRYETGQLKLHLLPTNVTSVIQLTLQVMNTAITAKALQVIFDCESAPTRVLTDPLRLQQIVTNLLSNAIRYTESGSIHIRCQEQPDRRWLISIQDTGIGIAPDDRPRIFEPYFRVEGDRSPESDGTGLGLAIVYRLVQLLQGEITVTSEVGVGSTFTVYFPLTVEVTGEE